MNIERIRLAPMMADWRKPRQVC